MTTLSIPKDLASSLVALICGGIIAVGIIVVLNYTFRPEPQLDPLPPLHLSDKWP